MNDQHKEKEGRNHRELNLSANRPHDQYKNDNSVVHPCIEAHNFLASQCPQGHDDAVPMNQNNQNAHANEDLEICRNEHNDRSDDSMLQLLSALEKPIFDPPTNYFWRFNKENNWFILYKKRNSGDIDTRIHVCPHFTGTFSVVSGEQEVIYVPTIRQAIGIAESLAHIFRRSLPAIPWYHYNSKEDKWSTQMHKKQKMYSIDMRPLWYAIHPLTVKMAVLLPTLRLKLWKI